MESFIFPKDEFHLINYWHLLKLGVMLIGDGKHDS